MPELSRFYGIIVRMFAEAGGPHHVPHFHAYWQGQVAVIGIDPSTSSRVRFPRASAAWWRRGPSCTRMNCATTGTDSSAGSCPARSPR